MADGTNCRVESIRGRCRRRRCLPYRTTLLGLVQRLVRQTESEREIVTTAQRLVRSGRVELTGSFRGERFDPVRR
jgi:hypothetical protein